MPARLMIPAALLAASFAVTSATAADDEVKVSPRVFLSVDKLPAGGTCDVAVLLTVEEGWHVYANPTAEDYQIPTKLSVRSTLGTTLVQTLYPAGKEVEVFGEKVRVYEGQALLFATVSVPASAAGRTETLTFEVNHQACSDTNCLAPTTASKPGPIPVAAAGERPKSVNPRIFAMKPRVAATGTVIK